MLRLGRIHIGSIKSCMAGFQLREKSANALLEDAVTCGRQGGRLLIDFFTPRCVIDISDIEMVIKH